MWRGGRPGLNGADSLDPLTATVGRARSSCYPDGCPASARRNAPVASLSTLLTRGIDVFIQYFMSPKQMTAFRLEPDIIDGLNRVKDRDGIPFSVQVDRALRAWLDKKGVTLKAARAASGTRKRSGGSR